MWRRRLQRVRRRSAAVPLLAVAAVALCLLGATLIPSSSGGYVAKITNSTNSAGTAPYFRCADVQTADRSTALLQLRLTEAAGSTTAGDASGNGNTGTYQGTMATSTTPPMACSRDGGSAYVLNGTSSYVSTNEAQQTNPLTFTLEVWFKTTVASGKLIGFGSSQTGMSYSYDRQIYLTSAGNLTFGIYNTITNTITSPLAYNDGTWHEVVATLAQAGAANAGMTLYVDGRQVAANSGYVTPQNYNGWWRFGYDNQTGWADAGNNGYFTGSMRYAAVYTSAFTAAQAQREWAAGQ